MERGDFRSCRLCCNMDPAPPMILLVEDHQRTRTLPRRQPGRRRLRAARGRHRRGRPRADGDALPRPRDRRPRAARPRRPRAAARRCAASDRAAGRLDPELPLLVLSGRAGELDRLRASIAAATTTSSSRSATRSCARGSTRCCGGPASGPDRGGCGSGRWSSTRCRAQVWLDGEPLHLSKKEFALLRALADEPTRVFTREELLRGVWGFRAMGQTRTLDSHASRLRKKLDRRRRQLRGQRLGRRLPAGRRGIGVSGRRQVRAVAWRPPARAG